MTDKPSLYNRLNKLVVRKDQAINGIRWQLTATLTNNRDRRRKKHKYFCDILMSKFVLTGKLGDIRRHWQTASRMVYYLKEKEF